MPCPPDVVHMSDSYQEPEELLRQAIEVGQLGYFVHDQRNETLF